MERKDGVWRRTLIAFSSFHKSSPCQSYLQVIVNKMNNKKRNCQQHEDMKVGKMKSYGASTTCVCKGNCRKFRSQGSLSSHEKICSDLKMGKGEPYYKLAPLQTGTTNEETADKILLPSLPLHPVETDRFAIIKTQILVLPRCETMFIGRWG